MLAKLTSILFYDHDIILLWFVDHWTFLHQNDVTDIPDLTFSMDADEEKHILYEKTEVCLQISSLGEALKLARLYSLLYGGTDVCFLFLGHWKGN